MGALVDINTLICVLTYILDELRCIKQKHYFRTYYRKHRDRKKMKIKVPPYMVKCNGVYQVRFE